MESKNKFLIIIRYSIISYFITLFLLTCQTFPEQNINSFNDLDVFINNNNFTGVVLVAGSEGVLFRKAYGKASVVDNIITTNDTLFPIASITKQFTSTLTLIYQRERLLNIQDSVIKYIPELPISDKITIYHLLTHTAGFPRHVYGMEIKSEIYTTSDFIKELKNSNAIKLHFKPGTRFMYSNIGYIILGYLLEKVSGYSLEELFFNYFFKPLKMEKTGFFYNNSDYRKAKGYNFLMHDMKPYYLDLLLGPRGSGGLFSTINDMYIWDRALNTDKILTTGEKELLSIPYKSDYALGWYIGKKDNSNYWYHWGTCDGYHSYFARYIETGHCIIIFCNQHFRFRDFLTEQIIKEIEKIMKK